MAASNAEQEAGAIIRFDIDWHVPANVKIVARSKGLIVEVCGTKRRRSTSATTSNANTNSAPSSPGRSGDSPTSSIPRSSGGRNISPSSTSSLSDDDAFAGRQTKHARLGVSPSTAKVASSQEYDTRESNDVSNREVASNSSGQPHWHDTSQRSSATNRNAAPGTGTTIERGFTSETSSASARSDARSLSLESDQENAFWAEATPSRLRSGARSRRHPEANDIDADGWEVQRDRLSERDILAPSPRLWSRGPTTGSLMRSTERTDNVLLISPRNTTFLGDLPIGPHKTAHDPVARTVGELSRTAHDIRDLDRPVEAENTEDLLADRTQLSRRRDLPQCSVSPTPSYPPTSPTYPAPRQSVSDRGFSNT